MNLLEKPVKAVESEKTEVEYRSTNYHTTTEVVSVCSIAYKSLLGSVVLPASLVPFWDVSTSFIGISLVIFFLMTAFNLFFFVFVAIIHEGEMSGIRKHIEKITAPITKDEWKLDPWSPHRIRQENFVSFYKAFYNPKRFFTPIALHRTTRLSAKDETLIITTDYLTSGRIVRDKQVVPANLPI